MRIYLFLVIFILLSFDGIAYWQSYQNDLRNTGAANGTGYFPAIIANFSDKHYGVDFQPLVGDIDNNGNNELIIFFNGSLRVYNSKLSLLDEKQVGAILGQPAIFNGSIVFNSRQKNSPKDYFFAYQLNNSLLHQNFNLTLANDGDFSGIKCLSLNGANSCIFKDKRNYIHIVDIDSKKDNSYNTSAYNETRQTVPAIGDIDNDGSLDAVFWFNPDSSGGYGFLAFDLSNRSIKWAIDDIFYPFFGVSSTFVLKGQPVLVDLNNDNKLEIAASVFYNDNLPNFDPYNDWFTELFVYNYNGSRLFSKCELNRVLNNGCNDGSSVSNRWQGTNPFVLESDKNGIDEICLIKDKKKGGGFKNMAINCYNYSGNAVLDSEISPATDAVKTAIAADMDNDGDKDIVAESNIYLQNGTAIFGMTNGVNFAVPADIDKNGGLDILWLNSNHIILVLDNSSYKPDLSVEEKGILFSPLDSARVLVTAIAHNNGALNLDNAKVKLTNTETLESANGTISIKGNSMSNFTAALRVNKHNKILVQVNYDSSIEESNEENNFAYKVFDGLPYVYVNTNNLEPSIIQSEFKDYIKNKLTSGYYTENEGKADIKVYIGKSNPINKANNVKTLNEFEFGYDYGGIIYYDKTGVNPYSALAASFKGSNGKLIVMVAGNEIEGNIAAAKEFIKSQELFLNAEDNYAIFVDDENADAIKVFDYLHLGGNQEHYNAGNEQFKAIVRNTLNDEMFNVYDKSVVASNGVTLRLRNLKPNMSSDYLWYLNSSGVPVEVPVVVAHGLFSNLTTWEVLGAEISNTGRDTWLIEITGGPYQDCDDCIDYTFHNLTDIFVPALLNGILGFTGKDKLQYVGFSNGCRSALDSLERGKFDPSKVETFVAVGCPGAFEGESAMGNVIASRNRTISNNLNLKNIQHPSVNQIIRNGLFDKNYVSENTETKISLNLYKFYEDIIINKNDAQPGNITMPIFWIIQGSALTTDDGIVTIKDEKSIYQNVNNGVNSKKYFDVFALHTGLDTNDRAKSIIRKSINKQELSFYEKIVNLINQSG